MSDQTTLPQRLRDKALRARQRAAVKRDKARLLRLLADCEDRSAAIDERLAYQYEIEDSGQ